MAFELPKLKYAYDALEPNIDARTMEIHYGKHHAGYTKKLNAASEGTDLDGQKIEDILANVSKHSSDPNVLNTLDIAPSSLSNGAAFENSLRSDTRITGRTGGRVLGPRNSDPAYHVQIAQTANRNTKN